MINFGFDVNTHYDVLVVAPSWLPINLNFKENVEVTLTKKHTFFSGYEIKGKNIKIAWAQIASGASNMIDKLIACAELNFDKLVFLGAVGSLTSELEVGNICTPSFSIAGVYAHNYLNENLDMYEMNKKVLPNDEDFVLQVTSLANDLGIDLKRRGVFCTDSLVSEYSHLDYIKNFNCNLIEMETSSFYLVADLLEKPSIAILVVSDNSATNESIINKSDSQQQRYDEARYDIVPKLLLEIARNKEPIKFKEEKSAMAVVFCKNKILTTKEMIYGKEILSLPKGHIEQNETIVDAAIRECYEETGIIVDNSQVLLEKNPMVIKFINHFNEVVKKEIYPIIFKVSDECQSVVKEERIVDACYMKIDKFIENCSYENIKNMVMELRDVIK